MRVFAAPATVSGCKQPRNSMDEPSLSTMTARMFAVAVDRWYFSVLPFPRSMESRLTVTFGFSVAFVSDSPRLRNRRRGRGNRRNGFHRFGIRRFVRLCRRTAIQVRDFTFSHRLLTAADADEFVRRTQILLCAFDIRVRHRITPLNRRCWRFSLLFRCGFLGCGFLSCGFLGCHETCSLFNTRTWDRRRCVTRGFPLALHELFLQPRIEFN